MRRKPPTGKVNRSAGGTQVTFEQNPEDKGAAKSYGHSARLSSICTDTKSRPFPPLAGLLGPRSPL